MILFRSSNAGLPGAAGFWGKWRSPKGGKDMSLNQPAAQPQMALQRQRLLTLAFGDMETIRVVSVEPWALSCDMVADHSAQLPTTFAVS